MDVFRLAKQRGFYNTYVTNGYMTPEALALAIESGLEAMNVDIKGDAASVKKFCKMVDVDQVWAAAKLARSRGVHIEITTLVIPTVNDSDSVLQRDRRADCRRFGPRGALARYQLLSRVPIHCPADTGCNSGARLANRQRGGPGIRLHR